MDQACQDYALQCPNALYGVDPMQSVCVSANAPCEQQLIHCRDHVPMCREALSKKVCDVDNVYIVLCEEASRPGTV